MATYPTPAAAQAAEPAPPGMVWTRGLSLDACEYCRAGVWVGHDHPECEAVVLVPLPAVRY